MTTKNKKTDFTISNIIKYSYHNFIFIFIGIIATLIIYILLHEKILKSKYKYLLISVVILLPIIIGILLFIIQHSPHPKKAYILSLLFDTDYGIKSDFSHHKTKGWPFVASSIININDKPHIFVGGGNEQKDALLWYNPKMQRFVNLIDKTILSSSSNSYSSVSIDMDNDGKEDLIIGRQDGVYLYKNLGNYKFTSIKIVNELDKVPLAIAISDYNKDGKPDIYLSYFTNRNKYRGSVFNNPKHGRKNILLQNKGIGKQGKIEFIDVTNITNAGGKPYNTFTGSFIDINADDWPDIVLSHDSGEVEILENKKGKFISHIPYEYKGNYMGIASGDYDNDGDIDLFLTNIGLGMKNKLARGDLRKDQKQTFKHILLRNDGKFKFIEESKEKGISGVGFGWGTIFSDADLDGDLDLLFAENTFLNPNHYIAPHPGHYYENINGKFYRKFKYRNPYFGQTVIDVDINEDNIKDIIWINMEGPVVGYVNNNIKNNYIIVDLPKNDMFVNAKIILDTGTDKYYKENVIGGIGFGGDGNDGKIIFGLGKNNYIKYIKIQLLNGKDIVIKKPKINSVIRPVVYHNKK